MTEENTNIIQEYNPETKAMQSEPVPPVIPIVAVQPEAEVPIVALAKPLSPQVEVAPIVVQAQSYPPMAQPVAQPVPQIVQAPVVQLVEPSKIIESPLLPEDNKKKGFWKKIWKSNKLKRPESVAILYLHENGSAEPMIVQSKKGFFNIKGKTYHERNDCTFTIIGKERYPLAIIDEWSITPRGTKEWNEKEVQEKVSLFQDHAIKGIRHAERVRLGERNEMQLNGKAIVGIAILAVIGIAFFMSYI